MRKVIVISALPLIVVFLSGCKTLDTISQIGTSIGVATGTISQQQAASIKKTSSAVGKTFESITPEQEYYIGRAVAATILKTHKPYDNKHANHYLNVIGQTLASASDKPETFGGYHFLIMDTPEINAFAAPGGLIFVSRGLLRCCKSEDAFAAVLAHEIGHVQHEHGMQAIKKSRLTTAFTVIAAESAKSLGGKQLAELTSAFEGAIGDITSTMINSGYARKFETQADKAAVTIMERVGYNPYALKQMLSEMDKHIKSDSKGFARTHPDPKIRIKDIESLIRNRGPVSQPPARKARFKKAMKGI